MLHEIDRSALNTEQLEQGLLGCILLNPEAWVSVVGKVQTSDFYNPVHGRIFSRIELIVDAGKRPDALTIKPFFRDRPRFGACGQRRVPSQSGQECCLGLQRGTLRRDDPRYGLKATVHRDCRGCDAPRLRPQRGFLPLVG